MEGVSAALYSGLKGYWRRRSYEKLNGSSGRRRSAKVERGSTQKRRRFRRIKITPKLKFLRGMPSPKKILQWLRDAYVNMMLGFANSRVGSRAYGGAGIGSFGKGTLQEYDGKMIAEIYKTLVMAQGELVPRRGTRLGSVLWTNPDPYLG